jgi:hypothetical protein
LHGAGIEHFGKQIINASGFEIGWRRRYVGQIV